MTRGWRAALLALAAPACASAESWTITPLDAADWPAEIVAETRAPAPEGGLPDGHVETYAGGDIVAAWYVGPTDRYRHAVLGDATEAGGLMVETAGGAQIRFDLPETEVFEDRTPRLADLDKDGRVDVITIRASVQSGAAVTVYGLDGDALVERATTPFIGTANRWLNVAGVADFAGAGDLQIAYVEKPHIGGNLYLARMTEGRLERITGLSGFSNHLIGARELRLSAIADMDGDSRMELAVPSFDRQRLRVVSVDGDRWRERSSTRLPARIDKAIALAEGASPGFVVGTDDGAVYEIRP